MVQFKETQAWLLIARCRCVRFVGGKNAWILIDHDSERRFYGSILKTLNSFLMSCPCRAGLCTQWCDCGIVTETVHLPRSIAKNGRNFAGKFVRNKQEWRARSKDFLGNGEKSVKIINLIAQIMVQKWLKTKREISCAEYPYFARS